MKQHLDRPVAFRATHLRGALHAIDIRRNYRADYPAVDICQPRVGLSLPPAYAVDLFTRIYSRIHWREQMTKKAKLGKKATKSSKRTEVAAKPEDEIDTDNMSAPTEVPQATPPTPEAEVAVESQQPVEQAAPGAPATPVIPSAPITRSEAARANIKEGLRLHQIAGRPTRQQLTLVFGEKGYLLTWPKRTERFGITPETFQAALAKGVPAVPLTPVTKPTVEKTKETV